MTAFASPAREQSQWTGLGCHTPLVLCFWKPKQKWQESSICQWLPGLGAYTTSSLNHGPTELAGKTVPYLLAICLLVLPLSPGVLLADSVLHRNICCWNREDLGILSLARVPNTAGFWISGPPATSECPHHYNCEHVCPYSNSGGTLPLCSLTLEIFGRRDTNYTQISRGMAS